jgi:hypothetical protein
MIETINEETYYEGTQQKTGVIYSEVTLVSFMNKDGVIVKETIEDEELGTLTINRALNTNVLKYTDQELKALIDGTGNTFNSEGTNLLLAEINSYVNDIILKDITDNPGNYYGLTVEKWQAVA